MSEFSQREAIDRVVADLRASMHTSFPARVTAYDVERQTVDIKPALKREVPTDDPAEPWEFEDLPEMLSVQVMWQRAGGHVITFPIKPGDWVLVVCAEQSTLLWRTRATTNTPPGFNDPFGLNGCVAIPGWFPDAQALENVSADDLVIGDLESDATVRIKPDGTVVLGGEQGAGLLALASKVDAELSKIATTFKSFAPGSGGAVFGTPYVTPPPSVAATKVKAR